MKKLALLLGLVICTIAASTAYATTRGDGGSPLRLAHPGEALIESEPGVYIVAPRSVRETSSVTTAAAAVPEPAASSDQMHLVRPGEVLIESESGVYIVAPHSVLSR